MSEHHQERDPLEILICEWRRLADDPFIEHLARKDFTQLLGEGVEPEWAASIMAGVMGTIPIPPPGEVCSKILKRWKSELEERAHEKRLDASRKAQLEESGERTKGSVAEEHRGYLNFLKNRPESLRPHNHEELVERAETKQKALEKETPDEAGYDTNVDDGLAF